MDNQSVILYQMVPWVSTRKTFPRAEFFLMYRRLHLRRQAFGGDQGPVIVEDHDPLDDALQQFLLVLLTDDGFRIREG
jgi:hypothetical protein